MTTITADEALARITQLEANATQLTGQVNQLTAQVNASDEAHRQTHLELERKRAQLSAK